MKTTKRWNKKAMLTVTCATLAMLMVMTVGAWSAFAGAFSNTGTTVAQTEATWGKSVAIQKFNDGTEKRFYKLNAPPCPAYRAFVFKNGVAIDDGTLESTAPEPKAQPNYEVIVSK